MAALLNALLLLVAVGGIGWESLRRFSSPTPTAGRTVIIVAAVGVLINAATALMFMGGRRHDLNIRAAFLHMAADAGVSAGVVAAGLGIMWTGWLWIDPLVSLAIAAVILAGTWGLFKDSMNLALQAVPAGIDAQAVAGFLSRLEGGAGVHDLHIWAMSTTETALTAHIVKPDPEGDDRLLALARSGLLEKFGIAHVTLQLERNGQSVHCGDACSPQD